MWHYVVRSQTKTPTSQAEETPIATQDEKNTVEEQPKEIDSNDIQSEDQARRKSSDKRSDENVKHKYEATKCRSFSKKWKHSFHYDYYIIMM